MRRAHFYKSLPPEPTTLGWKTYLALRLLRVLALTITSPIWIPVVLVCGLLFSILNPIVEGARGWFEEAREDWLRRRLP